MSSSQNLTCIGNELFTSCKLRRKSKATVNLKTEPFGNTDPAVILQFCTTLLTLLMMTAESMMSKRSVLRFTVVYFSIFIVFRRCKLFRIEFLILNAPIFLFSYWVSFT